MRDDDRIIQLLTPPFDGTAKDPGYIRGYVPGVRENGGQYTHAALWSVLATAMGGDSDRAFELFQSVIEYHIPKLARTELTGKEGGDIVTRHVVELHEGPPPKQEA